MARVPYLEPDDLDPEHRYLLERPINLAKATAHSPGGARAFNRLGGWIRSKSTLDPRLREIAILRIGVVTRTEYEYSHHVKIGRASGMSDDDIRAVIAGPGHPSLGELEELVVRAADEATNDLGVSEATVTALQQHLSDELLVELTIVISFYNGVVRLLNTLAIDVEPDYLRFLEEFPLD